MPSPVTRALLSVLALTGWLAGAAGCVSIPDVDQARARAAVAGGGGAGSGAVTAGAGGHAGARDTSALPDAAVDVTTDVASGSDVPLSPAPLVTRTFRASADVIPNPERGVVADIDRINGDTSALRNGGYTLVYLRELIDVYKTKDLEAAYLNRLEALFDLIRKAGVKVVLRFAYNTYRGDDAPKANVIRHIQQLKPVLARNADVIFVWQAGFVGGNGTWTNSTNNLLSAEAKAEIYAALIDATPGDRALSLPFASDRQALVPEKLTAANAYKGSPTARTSLYDSCLLNDTTDANFYPMNELEATRAYTKNVAHFLPFGAGVEVCTNLLRFTCDNVISELREQEMTYLQTDGADMTQLNTLTTAMGGCMPALHKSLGYRFVLSSVKYSKRVAPGGTMDLEISLANEGWSSLHNARTLFVTLDDGKTRTSAALSADPRGWMPGQPVVIKTKVRVPKNFATGMHKVALWLPDAASTLRDKIPYAIRFANEETWDAGRGHNVVGTDLEIDPTAPGDVDPFAMELKEVP